ncbi:PepSY domain-containing protein [Thalassotalea maritima]|uniref:PepSY domain-containing protein n=1 Tax=Thalassotalea maritima TaxID=3242416 RepID=UPI0035282BD2
MKYMLLAWLFFSVNAVAALPVSQDLSFKPHHQKIKQQRKVLSKQHAAKLAKNKYGGKVLGVQDLNGKAYRVKLLTNKGHIIYALVNAQTGKVSK